MRTHTFLQLHLLQVIRALAKKVSRQFSLKSYKIDLFDHNDPERKLSYGLCYPDGHIYIDLHNRRSRKYGRLESIIDTVVHELAHLKYPNHSRQFWASHKKMKQWVYKKLY